ncbi:MAG: hypothetical protein R3Y28_07050 [Candidatus Gastranaerophilales bacterium]
MKVNLNLDKQNNKINNKANKTNFEGYKPVKSDYGYVEYEFNYPYDENKYDCYLEVFDLKKDKRTEYYDINTLLTSTDKLDDKDSQEKGIQLRSGKNPINLTNTFGLNEGTPFAYHYKLYPKNNRNNPIFRVDTGNVIDKTSQTGMGYEIYNVVNTNGSLVTKGGAMKHVLPDSYNANWVYDEKNPTKIIENPDVDEAKNSIKNTANKIGGSLAGLEKDVEAGKFDNFSRILATPIFTDDSLSAHSYWNKNCMQTSQSLGNINNYSSLQKKMFAKDINFVSDGAFVNEGLEGVHFKHILKWGENSPYFYWFKVTALQDSPFALGVFGKDNKNIAHRVVNPKNTYKTENGAVKSTKNPNYEDDKPTFIQVYDRRLVKDPEKLDSQKLIKSYKNLSTENPFEINNHNDTVVPYSFEINPETYDKNMNDFVELNKSSKKSIDLNSFEATRMLTKFETFEFEEKFESGMETWDANADIAKLNYIYSHTDTLNLKQSLDVDEQQDMISVLKKRNFEVQDYAITSGQYWTRKTNQILMTHIAQNLNKTDLQKTLENNNSTITSTAQLYKKLIEEKSNGEIFPTNLKSKMSEKVIENILVDDYYSKTLDGDDHGYSYKELVTKSLMDLPLDSIELSDSVTAVFASPFLTKRANNKEELGMSRYDYSIENAYEPDEQYQKTFSEMNRVYKHEMSTLASEVLNTINDELMAKPEKSPLYNVDDKDEPSDLGKFVIPIISAEIAKFAIIKSIYPEAKFKVDSQSGEISYDYNKLKSISLNELGIYPSSPKDEARQLLSKVQKNMTRITSDDKVEFANAILASISDTTVESYKIAEAIIDRTEAGLDWRIDAVKDIADVDALRNEKNNFEQTWDNIAEFWGEFNKNILNENRNSMLIGEVTGAWPLLNQTNSPSSEKYSTAKEAERQLISKTGFTTLANYGYFFTDISKIFSKNFQNGTAGDIGNAERIFNLLVGKVDTDQKEFLYSSSLPSTTYSYNVIGNHDVSRPLHVLSLDTELFYADLTNEHNHKNRELAFRILNDRFDGKAISNNELKTQNWSDVSNKAVAMGDSLNRGFGKSLKDLYGDGSKQQKEIWEKISPAISDLANGVFKGQNFEAEGFGVKPFDVTIEAVLAQAEHSYGLELDKDDRKELVDKTFEKIIDPAYTKLLGMMKYLVALPGCPTLYSGDDLAATGYETETKNVYMQNRAFLNHQWVDEKSSEYKKFVAEKKNAIDALFAFRNRPELRALNDGASFVLNPIEASINGGWQKTKVTGLLKASTDGAMTISLFNGAGMHDDFSKIYSPSNITMNSINISGDSSNQRVGLAAGLKVGAIFANAHDKNQKYVVREYNGQYFLKKYNGAGKDDGDISFADTTLVLYHTPEMQQGKQEEYKPSFNGRKVLYNPKYNFVSNPYSNVSNTKNVDLGKNLQLTCK